MRAYVWTTPGDRPGNRLRLILDPVPRLQIDGETGWEDRRPADFPRTLFAKLAEVLCEIESLEDALEVDGDQPSGILEKCFEVVEIEEED